MCDKFADDYLHVYAPVKLGITGELSQIGTLDDIWIIV